jgi:hypothetical protein
MVKRVTFWEVALAAALIVIGGAYGLAVAKEKMVLKYLPVDHDIEMVRQENKTNPIVLNQTPSTPQVELIVKGHVACIECRQFDQNSSQCPDCCLYDDNTKIHCQDEDDPDCPNPGVKPFDMDCDATFARTGSCSPCASPCAKYPDPKSSLKHCLENGCPATTNPNNATCIQNETHEDIWYCPKDKIRPYNAAESNRPDIVTSCNYTFSAAYDTEPVFDVFCDKDADEDAEGHCWEYKVKHKFAECVADCTDDARAYEDKYYDYNRGLYSRTICDKGSNCTAGFGRANCDVANCRKKIDDFGGCVDYTPAKCVTIESEYRKLLLGKVSTSFREISPGFGYKFVARSGERYMLGWQVLCEVKKAGESEDLYSFYTMVKVLDQESPDEVNPVYQSIVHQKSLNSSFFINAQTGLDPSANTDPKLVLKPGHAYIVKLYYYLPNDGATPLQVEVSLMQLILYRTKN